MRMQLGLPESMLSPCLAHAQQISARSRKPPSGVLNIICASHAIRSAMRYLPNALTVGRILLTPVVLFLLTVPTWWGQVSALVLFLVASASDYLDGRLARAWNVKSRFGQFLDPLADKILVLGLFITFAVVEPGVVPWWAVVVIALRDVGVTALRSYAEAQGRTLATFRIAKSKTAAQMAFLLALLCVRVAQYSGPVTSDFATYLIDSFILYGALVGVVLLTVGTGLLYAIAPQEETIRPNPPRSSVSK